MLLQQGHLIAFSVKNNSTYLRELHAITMVIRKRRHYLLGRRFIIETDQKKFKRINGSCSANSWSTLLSKLLGYDYQIKYKLGKDNKAAYAVWRLELPFGVTDSTSNYYFLKKVKKGNETCKDWKLCTRNYWHNQTTMQTLLVEMVSFTIRTELLSTLSLGLHY